MTESQPPASLESSLPAPGAWTKDFVLLLWLALLALMLHYLRGPTPMRAYPSIMGPAVNLRTSDPPSLDELLHLSLSTGRGTPLEQYPHDTLLPAVPDWTGLKDAPSWWAVWTHMDGAFHPPLYVQTLRFWRTAFGGSDIAAISFSCFWSVVALVFVYLAARSAFGRVVGFWSAAVLAVAPVSSYYAIEIRGYAMITAESAVVVWLMVRMTRFGVRAGDLAGLCVGMLACMLTHYFAAPACLAAGLYVTVIAGRAWWRVVLAGLATAAVYAVIWLPFALRQLHILAQDLTYLRSDSPAIAWKLRLAVTLPYRLLSELQDWPSAYVTVAACLFLLAGVVLMAVRRPAMRPFLVWYVAVAGFLLLTDVVRQTMQLVYIRYPSAAQPAVAVFVPAVASLARRAWLVHVAGVALCGVVLYTQPNTIHNDAPTCTPAVTAIAPRMKPGEALILYATTSPGEADYFTEWLLLDFMHVPGLFPRDVVILNRPMSAELARQLAGRRAWVLMTDAGIGGTEAVPQATVLGVVSYERAIDRPQPMPAFYVAFPTAPATAPAG